MGTPHPPTPVGSNLDPNYVTGFCEGEASFTFVRNGAGINLRFAIRLHESDRALIHSLRDFFAVGAIYEVGPRAPGPNSGRTGPSFYYCATSVRDLLRIASHFESFPLRGRKAENFTVWRRMLELKTQRQRNNFSILQQLALTLSGMSTKGRRDLKPRVVVEQ